MTASETEFRPLQQRGGTATLAEHQAALYILLAEFDRVCRELDICYFLFAGTLLGAVRHKGFIPWDDDADVIMLRRDYERFLREAPPAIDFERFFLQAEYSEHWPMFFSKLRLNGTSCLEKFCPRDLAAHQGVYIDIFPCDNAFQNPLGRRLQFLCSKVVIAKGLYARGYYTKSKLKKVFTAVCRILPNKPFLKIVKGPTKETGYVHSFLGAASRYSKNVYRRECFSDTVRLAFESGEFFAPQQYDVLLRIMYGDYMSLPPESERERKVHSFLVDLKRPYQFYEGYRAGMKFEAPTQSIR